MNKLLSKINIIVNKELYLKDPQSSALGEKILLHGIDLIDKIGFEDFTFKKLATLVKSSEASIYRYFDNKHMFLLYLTSWYWAWMDYSLILSNSNIKSPEQKLKKAIHLITNELKEATFFSNINLPKLNRIVISESSKSYLSKDVDKLNKDGVFLNYKQFVARVAEIIKELCPSYKYPNMLVSTIIEGSHHQHFFADHLPKLTNKVKGKDSIAKFYIELSLKSLK